MSLIHDALRQHDEAPRATPASRVDVAEWSAQLPRMAPWILVAMLAAAVLWLAMHRPAPVPAPAVVAAAPAARAPDAVIASPVVVAPERAAPPPAPRIADATPASMPSPAAAPVPAPIPTPATVASARAPVVATSAAPMPPASRPPMPAESASTLPMQISVRNAAAARAADDPGNEAQTVRAAMARLNAAIGDHDAPATDAALGELQRLLPAQSLPLLRARAWAAHARGDAEQAGQLYRAILERVPEDEYAGINLALLDARQGRLDQAQERLARLAARNSRSAAVAQALDELQAMPR